MIIERRKMTVEKEIYIAPDGKEFDDEVECEEYELRLTEKSIRMYDYQLHKTDELDSCMYVKLSSLAEVNAFLKCCAYYGISSKGIENPGLYMYVEGTYGASDSWTNLSEILSKLEVLLANEN